MNITTSQIHNIANSAAQLIEMGFEPRSAIKQAASEFGISFGPEMKKVVTKVEKMLGL